MARRLPALDALRGLLALCVVLVHCQSFLGLKLHRYSGQAIVCVFFALSGFVLARSYDGRPVTFLAKRAVRLWPLFAICMLAGSFIYDAPVSAADLLWLNLPALGAYPKADHAAWSLYYEVWATPFMLLAFPLAKRYRFLALTSVPCLFLLMAVDLRFFYAPAFGLGVALAGFDIKLPETMPKSLLWLGKISYSLYLTHPLLLPVGFYIGGPLTVIGCLLLGWLAWLFIEKPTIDFSRALNFNRQGKLAV